MSGFNPIKKAGGSETSGMVQTFSVLVGNGNRLAPGDVVILDGSANSDGIANISKGNGTVRNTGVIASVDITLAGESLSDTGLPASTAGTVKVNIDPLQLYEVEVDATLAVTDVGLNCGINTTTATQSGGLTISNMTLDAGTKATSITLPFRIVALLEGATTGVLGDRAVVRPNATTESTGATGA